MYFIIDFIQNIKKINCPHNYIIYLYIKGYFCNFIDQISNWLTRDINSFRSLNISIDNCKSQIIHIQSFRIIIN